MLSLFMNLANLFEKRIGLIWLFYILTFSVSAQGLQFTGGHQPIEKRSSVEIFNHNTTTFDEYFDISFELELPNTNPIGYILRVKSKEQTKIFNLYYDEEDGNAVFRLNEEGKNSLITARIKQKILHDMRRFPLSIRFDLTNKRISLTINNQKFTVDNIKFPNKYTPLIFFGKSDHLIDVPPISIRNLLIGNNQKSYIFPLREYAGELLHSENGEVFGRVSNPTWLINDSYHWKKLHTYFSSTPAGADYSENRKEIYYFNQDSCIIHNLQSGESNSVRFSTPCPVKLVLGNSFIDDLNHKLYVYENYYDVTYNGPTVASLDLNNYTWKIESYQKLDLELHHHSYFINNQKKEFTIFGGYGNMMYSEQFYTYNLKDASWKQDTSYKGVPIIPRYFSSAGLSADRTLVYLFGGMGNEAGKHIVGREYFYDLYALNLNDKRIEERWKLDWKKADFVPARGIVVPDTNNMYVLGYPEHLTNSNIKLYQFSLKNGEYEILGDSIPIYSDRISTRAKLFYDQKQKKLLTLVQESTDDISSRLSLYVLNFPPISAAELTDFPREQSSKGDFFFAGIILLTVGFGIWIYRRLDARLPKRIITNVPILATSDTNLNSQKNSIYLFGDFTALNRDGMDISHLFSSQLKQTFCLLLSHVQNGGISSKLLSYILWPDKSKEKVKTSRGVTINNLRKVLNEFDGVEVIYDKGHFCLVISDNFYCDYNDCLQLIADGNTIDNQEFLAIISRGKFLLGEDHPVFDPLKDEIESKLTPILLQELQNYHQKNQHVKTIRIADILFELDPTNEEALAYSIKAMMSLKLENKAKDSYQFFLAEYQRMMGEDFAYSFDELRRRSY